MAIPQCLEAIPAATSKRDKPTMATAGAIVKGVINLRRRPMIPVKRKQDSLKAYEVRMVALKD